MALGEHNSMHIVIVLGIIALFGIITFALTAATLGTLNKEMGALHRRIIELDNKLPTMMTTTLPATISAVTTNTSTVEATTATTFESITTMTSGPTSTMTSQSTNTATDVSTITPTT